VEEAGSLPHVSDTIALRAAEEKPWSAARRQIPYQKC
jgi:hypothetical protein